MAKAVNEIVQRVNKWNVGDDCAQLMVPYKNAITILDRNGIVYHHKEGSELLINKYIIDDRRKQFPYYSIPTHYTKFFDGVYQYTNQLFDFEQPYMRINNGSIIESYVVKDRRDALLISKIMPIVKKTSFKTRNEIEEMIQQSTQENEKIYYIYLNGTMPQNNVLGIVSEEEIFNYIKEQLSKNIADFREYIEKEPYSTVSRYLKENEFFLKFIEKNIDKLDLNNYQMNLHLFDGKSVLFVKTNGKDISIQGLDIYFISPDLYKVDTYDILVTKYTLEQLKYLTSKITKIKEPKIPLKLNPGITKEDLKREKQLILQRKKQY